MEPTSAIGAQIGQSAVNMWYQDFMNEKNRRWAEIQGKKQRDYAVEDWNKTNAYNAPIAQKQRMKDAGLNPNMMYGGSGGVTTAAITRSHQQPEYKGIAPQSQINFQSLMQLPLMIEQTKQMKLLNDAKMLDNRLKGEAVGILPPTNNEYLNRDEDGNQMRNSEASYLKNNPYQQSGQLRDQDIIAKKYINEMNEATSEEQRLAITSKSTIAQIQAQLLEETGDTKIEMLNVALDNARSMAKIAAAQAQLTDNISPTSQYYIATLIKVLSLMK